MIDLCWLRVLFRLRLFNVVCVAVSVCRVQGCLLTCAFPDLIRFRPGFWMGMNDFLDSPGFTNMIDASGRMDLVKSEKMSTRNKLLIVIAGPSVAWNTDFELSLVVAWLGASSLKDS